MNFFSFKSKYFNTVCAGILITLSHSVFAGKEGVPEFSVHPGAILATLSMARNTENDTDFIRIDDDGSTIKISARQLRGGNRVSEAKCSTRNTEYKKILRSLMPDDSLQVHISSGKCFKIKRTRDSSFLAK